MEEKTHAKNTKPKASVPKAARRKRRTIILVALVLVVGLGIGGFFALSQMAKAYNLAYNYQSRTIYGLYQEKKDGLDGLYMGSSTAARIWIPTLAYEKEGFCLYNMGTMTQPFIATKYLIDEALKTQKDMKVILIEIKCLVRPTEMTSDKYLKYVTDVMNYSPNRNRLIKDYVDHSRATGADIDYGTLDYYIPAVRYKGAWLKEFDMDNFQYLERGAKFKGYIESFNVNPQPYPVENNVLNELHAEREEVLEDFLQYAKTIDVDVVFLSSPYSYLFKGSAEEINMAMKMCEDEGFKTIDFNKEPFMSQLDMDYDEHFYDYKHTNVYGAMHYTTYLTEYLKDNYELPDHREERGYESWDEAAELFHETLEEHSDGNE